MTSLKEIRHLLRDWIEDDSIDEVFASFINNAISECEEVVDFVQMYAESEVTVPESGVITEPARCREITEVVPVTASGYPAYRFIPQQRTVTQNDAVLAEYIIKPFPGFDEEEAEHTVSITQGSKTITQAGATFFTDADLGKRVMLDGTSELYEVVSVDTSTIQVSPKVTAEDDTSITARVNPAGTRQFVLRDPNNNLVSGDMTIKYQRKHPHVYSDNCLLQIPCKRTVALRALQQALMTNKYSVDAQRLNQSVIKAKHSELDNFTFRTTKRKPGNSAFSVRNKRGE